MNAYEITVRGRLSGSLTREFERQQFTLREESTETILEGDLEDQAALYGILRQLESLGLELVELHRVETAD